MNKTPSIIPAEINRQQLEALDKEQLVELILALHEQIQLMAVQLRKLQDQVAKNSSKPPSSDGM